MDHQGNGLEGHHNVENYNIPNFRDLPPLLVEKIQQSIECIDKALNQYGYI